MPPKVTDTPGDLERGATVRPGRRPFAGGRGDGRHRRCRWAARLLHAGGGVAQEDGPQELGVIAHLGRRPREADGPRVHDVDPVGHRDGHVDRLLDEEDRGPGVAQGPHGVEELLHHQRGQAERELVDQQQRRGGQQGHGQGQHLLLAAGEVAGPVVPPFGQHVEAAQGRRPPAARPAAGAGAPARRRPAGSPPR